VKNFQLIAPAGTGEPWGVQDDETVILQFKIEDDVFTMDYRQPLSAFQAFAISPGTRPGQTSGRVGFESG